MDRARVPGLVAGTLDRLATQAARHERKLAAEPWISAGQLRDDVLREEFSIARREDIWKNVRKVVEMNANVRASVREGRAGEISRVWEWIGNIDDLERPAWEGANGRGGRERKEVEAPPEDGRSGSSGVNDRALERRKWDEGRPIY